MQTRLWKVCHRRSTLTGLLKRTTRPPTYFAVLAVLLLHSSWSNGSEAKQHVWLDVDYISSVDYADGKDRLDVFMPESAEMAPILVFFHGGGLVTGNKQFWALSSRGVSEGYGIVLPNYRLSPSVEYPKHVEDAAAAVSWVFRNISRYGGNPEEIYVGGHSAGAYLAAVLSTQPAFLLEHGIDLSVVRGTLLLSPFLEVESLATFRESAESIWGTAPEVWRRSTVRVDHPKATPPFLLIYADGDDDWRKQQILDFEKALLAAGAPKPERFQLEAHTHNSYVRQIASPENPTFEIMLDFMKGN